MRVFVDTNVFLDYYFDRKDSVKPLGEFAFNFFNAAIGCRFTVLISIEVIEELELATGFGMDKIWEVILGRLKETGKIELLEPTKSQTAMAGRLKKEKVLPFNDCLFAAIAFDLGIPLVSRDRHFEQFEFVKAMLPEELL
jgi:predicted nucleic acid-binding protein